VHTLIHPTILTRTSTYNIKNSFEVIKDLKELHIPENALHFAADAKLMYTNIDTANGIETLKDFLMTTKTTYQKNSLLLFSLKS
jgi:hypothetical protein